MKRSAHERQSDSDDSGGDWEVASVASSASALSIHSPPCITSLDEDNNINGREIISPQKRQKKSYIANPTKRSRRKDTGLLLPAEEPDPLASHDMQLSYFPVADPVTGSSTRGNDPTFPPGNGDLGLEELEQSVVNVNDMDVRAFPSLDKQKNDNRPELSGGTGIEGGRHHYLEYVDCVLAGAAGFFRLEADLFVVQAWDWKRGSVKASTIIPNSWYHLQKTVIGDDIHLVCFCPFERAGQQCVHEQFLCEYGSQQFPEQLAEERENHRLVVIFQRYIGDTENINTFSVLAGSGVRNVKSRAIVVHTGDDIGNGTWTCSKDSLASCAHKSAALRYLRQCMRTEDDELNGATSAEEGRPSDLDRLGAGALGPRGSTCISNRPILAPLWAWLPTDTELYSRPSPILKAPSAPLGLDEYARCVCGTQRAPEIGTSTINCILYTHMEAFTCIIEVQQCSGKCSGGRHRFVGPDCTELGILNYNNRILFAHDLLEEYTKAFTSSETPFTAWVDDIRCRYERFSSVAPSLPFISEEIFRAAWFSYSRLQAFEPENVIFDGVTLAFGKKYMTSTLQPPTTIDSNSITRTAQYMPKQTFVTDAAIRRLLRRIVTGKSLVLSDKDLAIGSQVLVIATAGKSKSQDSGSDSDDEGDGSGRGCTKHDQKRAIKDVLERIQLIPGVRTALTEINPSLGGLFKDYLGVEVLSAGIQPPQPILALFREFSAEESVIQLCPGPSLEQLKLFMKEPTSPNLSRLRCIPALYYSLNYELHSKRKSFSPNLLAVCEWIIYRAEGIFNALTRYSEPPIQIHGDSSENSWLQSGSFYSMPQIRYRPQYPDQKHDQKLDGGQRRSKCSKFYAEYGEKRLTGGIMVCWCTHSISYGFHCIPKGEGRNDVFSALVTHWKKPPKWVIYDFACALAPYCMTREPAFFKQTRFGIDHCHSMGHTKCGPACFLKTYAELDPNIAFINSSAGECGNNGLKGIRKSADSSKDAEGKG